MNAMGTHPWQQRLHKEGWQRNFFVGRRQRAAHLVPVAVSMASTAVAGDGASQARPMAS